MLDERVKQLAQYIASLKQRKFLLQKPVYQQYQHTSAKELEHVEKSLGIVIPIEIKTWIITAGLGDINGELAFRLEFFSVFDLQTAGQSLIFAQDDLGNFYARSEVTGCIYYIARSEVFQKKIADDFYTFITELERRHYGLGAWIEELHD